METTKRTIITVEARVNAPVKKVWAHWTEPQHIMKWNSASEDWHTPFAENDLRKGGSFKSRMEAKDGSFGFDFGGTYDAVEEYKYIEYTMGDRRNVKVSFIDDGNATNIVESFEAEGTNPVEMQKAGWQSILDNFKRYTEGNS
ncbi:MAG: SRPBCC family protein [Flavisolibacter sp.]